MTSLHLADETPIDAFTLGADAAYDAVIAEASAMFRTDAATRNLVAMLVVRARKTPLLDLDND